MQGIQALRGSRIGLAIGLMLMSATAASLRAADVPAGEPAVSPTAVAPAPAPEKLTVKEISTKTWSLASDGHLQDLWTQIRGLPDQTPAIASLRQEIDLHESHERESAAKTLVRYNHKIEKLHKEAESGDLRKALAAGVEAYGLAEDPKQMLEDPKLKGLVERAEKQAEDNEKAGQWLKALTLYSNLNELYKIDGRYKEPMKRVGRRVGLMRLYAPEVLFNLYKAEALELGEDAPEPWDFSEDTWQKQLESIELVMLSESLGLAKSKHVEDCSFEQLLLGCIDQLENMLQTKGLEKTFASLGDDAKTKPMLDYLAELRKDIATRKEPMGYSEANGIVTKIMQKGRETVDLPEAVMVHELGDGATSTLDDFSTTIWPHQKARFERTTRGSFSGVGVQIAQVNRQLTVVTPIEDSPAFAAGIRAGDKIMSIDGKSTVGLDLDAAVDKITGSEGTKITLGILTPGDAKSRDVVLTRTTIKIVSIKGWKRQGNGWEYYIDPALKIAYVRMTGFGPTTADELDAAVKPLLADKGCNGLILDLRFNPGGRLDAAVAVSSRFISAGTVVSTTEKTFTGRPWTATADDSHTYPEFPVIVLVNKGSASASEIVSGCLQDHRRALIVGENSYGKGSVQNLFRLDDEKAYLKLTTQYYRLPNGQIIHRRPGATHWGVAPDVAVKMTDRQIIDQIEARTWLDILRDKGQELDPNAVISKPKPRKDDDEPVEKPALVKNPEDLLTRGLDPQLETALLLLKTRLLGEPHG